MLQSKNTIAYALFFIFRAILFPALFFIPLFLEEKGITGWQVGLLLGESTITGIFFSLPFGLLNDRVESKKLITYSLICGAIFFVLFATINLFIALVFIFLVFGLCRSLFQISFDSLFFKEIIKGKGCAHSGRYIVVYSLAGTCGLLITAFFIDTVSFATLFIFAGIIYATAILLSKNLHITPTVRISVLEYKKDILKPQFIIFGLSIFLFTLHWGAESTCYSLFLKHYLGLSARISALYMLAEFAALGVSAYFLTLLIDRYRVNLKWVFATGILLSGLTLILKVTKNFELSLFMRMLHGVGDGMIMIVIYYGIAKVFDIQRVGGNMSALAVMQLSGSFVGALVFSRIGKTYGYHLPFIMSGIMLICTSLLLTIYYLSKMYSRKKKG